ncbi:MAG TPA: HEAT repeat domain-containing protein [Polyangiaceae bacterium]|nr:HEAT repeat domain-containing protein [Polyangiaceae bacterium]
MSNVSTLRLNTLGRIKVSIAAMLCGLLLAGFAAAQEDPNRVYAGRSTVYQDLDSASLESTTTPDRIVEVTRSNVAPTEVWRALEHGEKVECLSCIPQVSKLLYNDNARTREIAAWWLRRRIFGVFGPGQVYDQTVRTLNDATQPVSRRAAAAEALGEFLTSAGVKHVARAAIGDASPVVRLSAVHALQRLNSEGPAGELAMAMGDADEQVRLAAITAAGRINTFTGGAALLDRLNDASSTVRVRAAQIVGQLRFVAAVPALIALLDAGNEGSAEVRSAAAAALGFIGDASARAAVQMASTSDPDRFVRNAARFALRRL